MKGFIATIIALSIVLASVPARADDSAPANGTVELFAGFGLLGVGVATGLTADYAASKSTSDTGYKFDMTLMATAGVIGLAGTGLALFGCVKSIQHEHWMQSHPFMSGLRVSPTSVGYNLTF